MCFFKTLLGPEIYVIELIFKPNCKTLFFFNAGRTFDVSKIAKTPFYTLNMDRITKPQKFNVKNISIRHIKKNKKKYCVTMAYKYYGKSIITYAGYFGHLMMSHRFFF